MFSYRQKVKRLKNSGPTDSLSFERKSLHRHMHTKTQMVRDIKLCSLQQLLIFLYINKIQFRHVQSSGQL